MAGVHTPVEPIKHQYVLIGPIPEVIEYQKQHGHQLPVLRDLAGSYYIRQERDGLLVGPYENEKVMEICEDWARYLYLIEESDYSLFMFVQGRHS